MKNSYNDRKKRLKIAVQFPLNRPFNDKGISYTLHEVERQLCDLTGIEPKELNEATRRHPIVIYRQMAHYKAYFFCLNSLGEIASHFGNQDHCTVINSRKTIQNILDTDKRFREKYGEFLSN